MTLSMNVGNTVLAGELIFTNYFSIPVFCILICKGNLQRTFKRQVRKPEVIHALDTKIWVKKEYNSIVHKHFLQLATS